MIRYHMIAFLAGFLLDLIIGDPYWLPHPIRWIGSLISHMEQRLLEPLKAQKTADSKKEFQRGILLVIAVVTPSVALPVYTSGAWLWASSGTGNPFGERDDLSAFGDKVFKKREHEGLSEASEGLICLVRGWRCP